MPPKKRKMFGLMIGCYELVTLDAVFTLSKNGADMKRFVLAVTLSLFAIGSAFADDTCESKAVGKDGKPLAGAAKTSFLKKCKADACEGKAVSADGKPLSGAAKASFLKKCEADA
jgi:hypothetical protein